MDNIFLTLLVGAGIGVAAGYVGAFMVMRRMALVGDALSHVALPGIAIALMLHAAPMLGAFIALFIAVIGVWYLQKTTSLFPETLVGIFFTTSLAIGILITPEPDLLEALFGSIEKITPLEGAVALAVSVILIVAAFYLAKYILLDSVSDELARASKLPVNLINLAYLLLVGAIVAVGVRFVGSLLMGALVIIPAAAARNISGRINQYYLYSVLFGLASSVVGIAFAFGHKMATGPVVVLTSAIIFIITYFVKVSLAGNIPQEGSGNTSK